ncbi:hypothetical protein L1049_022307 [Liquidambar formosana]|uniref:Disease resistance R13L4/SHOC-2-like LRR domain-containing protein n=1 Tax=Liquidambar formosana TaxID=63359 RepID=A0AAP0WNX7_LIQFO
MLFLYKNRLSGEVPCVVEALDLAIIDLSKNNLTGTIPNGFGKLVKLRNLHLFSNQLSGEIPWVVEASNLEEIILCENNLTGTIPDGFEKLVKLRCLGLCSNQLTGTIPDDFGKLAKLEVLYLYTNNLSGKIPSSLFRLKNLTILYLSINRLSGEIPRVVEALNLAAIDLSNNKLTRTIPDDFGKLGKLWYLSLFCNQLSGQILESPGRYSVALQVLVLQSNTFHGSIGDSNTSFPFPKLRILDLSHNQFIGLLPTKYFTNLNAMINVDEEKSEQRYMGDRYYFASVRVTIKGLKIELVKILTIFTTIDLFNNKFQGVIPKFIGNLNSLRVLNLSYNCLTGHMPLSLGNLRLLESLDLSSNKLDSVIPLQLGLHFLEYKIRRVKSLWDWRSTTVVFSFESKPLCVTLGSILRVSSSGPTLQIRICSSLAPNWTSSSCAMLATWTAAPSTAGIEDALPTADSIWFGEARDVSGEAKNTRSGLAKLVTAVVKPFPPPTATSFPTTAVIDGFSLRPPLDSMLCSTPPLDSIRGFLTTNIDGSTWAFEPC